MNPQPAKKSYFFAKGYQDLANTIKEANNRNLLSAQYYWSKARTDWNLHEGWGRISSIFLFFAGVSVVVFGTLFFITLSLLHIIILSIFFSLIYLSFSALWGIDKSYRIWHRIFTACPSCHHKSEIPAYQCPSCGVIHDCLIPSSYGIWQRRCECGAKLPTTFLNGRNQLAAFCPNCNYELNTQEEMPICIPIVGGPAVGKTCFLFAVVNSFKEQIAPKNYLGIDFLSTQDAESYARTTQAFEQGIPPPKTTIGAKSSPTAFNFFISHSTWQTKRIMYLYDAAGESFQNSDILKQHGFYSFFNGIIFLIDPFSIYEVALEYEQALKTNQNNLKPSEMLLEDVFDMMVINLEKNYQVGREQRITKPLALVINKVDAFDLADKIGQPAAQTLLQKSPNIHTLQDATHQLCQEQFKQWNLGNFLNKLEHKFAYYRFFTCSALGHMPDSSNRKFEGYDAVQPLLWIMRQVDKRAFGQLSDY